MTVKKLSDMQAVFLYVFSKEGWGMEQYLRQECVKLRSVTGVEEYLDQLNRIEGCIVILAAKDTLGFQFSEKLAAKVKALGLEKTLSKQHGRGYIGIVSDKLKKYEILGEVNQTVECKLMVKALHIEVKSSPFKAENIADIIIDGINYAVNKRGINIVVYDKLTDQVVDSVCFDTHTTAYACNRKSVIGKRFDPYLTEFEWIKSKLTEIDANVSKIKKEISKKNISTEGKIRAERLKIQNIMSYECYAKNMLMYQSASYKEDKQNSTLNKIKVRFYFWGNPTLWNAMKTVAECFQKDNRCDVLVIINACSLMAEKIKVVANSGLRICLIGKYKIDDDRPDILILNNINMHSAFDLTKVRYLVAIPFVLVSGEDGIDIIKNFALQMMPYDAVLIEKFLYDKMEKRNFLSEKVHLMGNPKFDGIYQELHKHHKGMEDEKWKKMTKLQKVVLLATDHNWDTSNVTFDLYIHHMLSWFAENQKMGLIIRPHQNYPLELMNNNVWSKEDFQKCMDFCNSFDNILWDDSSDYSLAYSMADAVLTDVNCGITVSALSLNKPLGVLRRFDGSVCKPVYPEIVDKLYCIDNLDSCTQFLEMIERGEDTRYEDRQKLFEKYVSHFDGKNGQRIKEFVMEKYNEKCWGGG